ncbi:copper oxidase [Pseudomonas jessenii]|uniref:Ig-like domain-containing protein n=1 Tax=Pseudomonas jessenii TaxID=77298 RepID=UPI000B8AE3C3|nr:multicopper oxidase domain-containing protein [Pseudomonas jessenii]OXR29606.1 copper oxidase [Pseudomonas jessenii]
MKNKTDLKSLGLFSKPGIAAVMLINVSLGIVNAAPLDDVSPPPPTDPSAYTNPPADPQAALDAIETMPPTNQGSYALPNGVYGTRTTPTTDNVLPPSLQTSFKIPTNGKPSPLFGAQPYTQQLLLFEEFGTEKLDPTLPAPPLTFPVPIVGPAPTQDPNNIARSGPSAAALEAFMRQPGLYPFPAQYSNVLDRNPWKAQIEAFLNRHPVGSPAEGRPPGKGWSHQRWNEFYPQVAFKTTQAGAKLNGGMRDRRQLHNYAVGEFGPGGLYNQTSDTPVITGTTKGIDTRFHPNMPIQNHKALWTFDGTFPPKLLMVRYGQPVLMRHYNALPIDPSANMGFGLHTLSTHEHNGHSPAESDGYSNAFFFPGQYYDYRWPIQLAGYDTINTSAQDPRAAFPCAPGETLYVNDATPGLKTCNNGSIKIRGDWHETMSTHWFHDHMLDFTAQNVYKGNAVMMNYYSALDRGNEAFVDGVNLRLPSGSALPWGNRDYDVNLLLADKAWDANGQLWFNPFNTDGFLGDQLLVNWQYQPRLKVRARSYRFRILNGSVSRYFKIALVREIVGTGGEFPGPTGSGLSYTRVPFHLIANDGNLMEHAVPFDGSMDLDADGDLQDHNAILPTMGIAERYDIIVNFAKNGISTGDKLYFVNLMEHHDGKGPESLPPSLADVLSGRYKAVLKLGSKGLEWDAGDPVVGKFLQLLVQPYAGQDVSMNPADYEPAKPGKAMGKTMLPLTLNRDDLTVQAKLKLARHREFIFGRSDGTDEAPWTIKTDGGLGFQMDPRVISAAPQLANGPTAAGFSGDGTLEVWRIRNGGNGWNHPVHVHFEEGIVLNRDGKAPPEWEKWARKDIYRIGEGIDSSQDVEMAIRFREFAGTYMEHCHNTQHEDTSMLLRWDVEHPGQFQLMPTPLPGWDGVNYVNSAALPTFRTGDTRVEDAANQKPIANPDSAISNTGQPVIINVLANDSDPDGNVPLKVVGLEQPDSGKGVVSTDGLRVTYTPPATVPAPFTATFTYKAADAKGAESAPATVSVAVSAAINESLIVTSATVTARSNSRWYWVLSGTTSRGTGNTITATATTTTGTVNLGAAVLTPTATGARWNIAVTTAGSGPSPSPTATIKSAFGKTVTVPIKAN